MTARCVIAQLSDPHLTTPIPAGWQSLGVKRLLSYLSWRRSRRYRHRVDLLRAVLDDLRASRPDHLLVTGDLTHLGLPGECREALRWLHELGDPQAVSVIPGNHDLLVEDDWAVTGGLWREYFAPDPAPGSGAVPALASGASGRDRAFPYVRRRAGIALVGLNSAVPTPPLFASGRLGAEQRGRLAGILDELGRAGLFRLVFLHHSPLAEGHAWRKRLRDADALLAVLRDAGAELVVHGHGHHEELTTVATPAGPMLVVGAPSASLAGDYAAGWNRYVIDPAPGGWSVTVECRRYGPAGVSLRASSRHALPRDPVTAVR